MAPTDDFPKPKYITGGCLCSALRYRIDFPEGHDFLDSSGTCQCTQCRRNTSSLLFVYHAVAPFSSFTYTSPDPKPRTYRASPESQRVFCGDCGSLMYWRRDGKDRLSVAVGTIDPLYLWGEGAEEHNQSLKADGGGDGSEGQEVPVEGGFARALVNGEASHEWCGNEIPGVTDKESLALVARGERVVTEG